MEKEKIKKWGKSLLSAIIGAALSFGVTFGIISEQKATEIREQFTTLDQKSEELIKALEAKDLETALAIAKELTKTTKELIDNSKEVISEAKKAAEEAEEAETEKTEETEETPAEKTEESAPESSEVPEPVAE